MEKLTEQRVREIVREELEAAGKATAQNVMKIISDRLELQLSQTHRVYDDTPESR